MEGALDKVGLVATRISCQDANALTPTYICKLYKDRKLSRHSSLVPTQIAISMSHAKVWERLVQSDNDYALIFEDDARPLGGFVQNLNAIFKYILITRCVRFDILWLWNGDYEGTSKHLKRFGIVNDIHILEEKKSSYTAGAAAYVIHRNYAKRLLDNFFPIEHPIDVYAGMRSKYGVTKRHFTLKMKVYDINKGCIQSDLVKLGCGGFYEWEGKPAGGQGRSTQNYNAEKVNMYPCFYS